MKLRDFGFMTCVVRGLTEGIGTIYDALAEGLELFYLLLLFAPPSCAESQSPMI